MPSPMSLHKACHSTSLKSWHVWSDYLQRWVLISRLCWPSLPSSDGTKHGAQGGGDAAGGSCSPATTHAWVGIQTLLVSQLWRIMEELNKEVLRDEHLIGTSAQHNLQKWVSLTRDSRHVQRWDCYRFSFIYMLMYCIYHSKHN